MQAILFSNQYAVNSLLNNIGFPSFRLSFTQFQFRRPIYAKEHNYNCGNYHKIYCFIPVSGRSAGTHK